MVYHKINTIYNHLIQISSMNYNHKCENDLKHSYTHKEAFAKRFPISLGQICVLTSQAIHHWVKHG